MNFVHRKWINSLVVLTFLLVSILSIPSSTYAESIKERIQKSQGDGTGLAEVEKKVDESTTKGVSSARRIFVTITIIFGLWLAITYLRAGFSPDALRETKGRIMFFMIFLALSFWTESILGFIFNILGIDLNSL